MDVSDFSMKTDKSSQFKGSVLSEEIKELVEKQTPEKLVTSASRGLFTEEELSAKGRSFETV